MVLVLLFSIVSNVTSVSMHCNGHKSPVCCQNTFIFVTFSFFQLVEEQLHGRPSCPMCAPAVPRRLDQRGVCAKLRKLFNERERQSLFSATWRGLRLFPGPKTEPSHWPRGEGEIRGLPETLPETLVSANQEGASYMDLIH